MGFAYFWFENVISAEKNNNVKEDAYEMAEIYCYTFCGRIER